MQLKSRLREIQSEVEKATDAYDAGRIDGKRFTGIVNKLGDEAKEIQKTLKSFREATARYAGGADLHSEGRVMSQNFPGFAGDPSLVNPYLQSPAQLAPDQVRELVNAFHTKTPVTLEVQTKGGWRSGAKLKSPMTESGLATPLPGIEMPNQFMGFPYEPTRIASYLPGAGMDGPSAFWLSETAHAAEAAPVAENTGKPDLQPTLVNNQVLPMKIAGQFSATLELIQDYAGGDIGGMILYSLQRSIINQENAALLSAVKGTNNATFNGFLNTSGTLSQNSSGLNGIDGIVTAAAAMRTNSGGFAAPDVLITTPNTVAGILMQKDNQGRYLNNVIYGGGPGGFTWNGSTPGAETTAVAPGGFPAQGANGGDLHLAGIPTVQTTQLSDGTAIMLSVRNGAGVYWTRLNMLIFFDPYTGLTNNTFRWVAETRVALSVPRPAAVSVITNLPVG
jgi:hypothetical protein